MENRVKVSARKVGPSCIESNMEEARPIIRDKNKHDSIKRIVAQFFSLSVFHFTVYSIIVIAIHKAITMSSRREQLNQMYFSVCFANDENNSIAASRIKSESSKVSTSRSNRTIDKLFADFSCK